MSINPTKAFATPVSANRLICSKRAYSSRRIEIPENATLIYGDTKPRPGDLVLVHVDRLGQHQKLELTNGRRAAIQVGDELLVVYGNRYAPAQFESVVPDDTGPCHLVAGGGIASRVRSAHGTRRSPTQVTPIALIGDTMGRILNVEDYALQPVPWAVPVPTIAVFGTAMDSGKTTTMAAMASGETRTGKRVGAAKATGTAYGGDTWAFLDGGADCVVDFTDAGHVSTYGVSIARTLEIIELLKGHLAAKGVDLILLEIADGLLHTETSALIESDKFREMIDGVVFAASDSMGAVAGIERLQRAGLPVLAVSGTFTLSPLMMEEAKRYIDVDIVRVDELQDGTWLPTEFLRRSDYRCGEY